MEGEPGNIAALYKQMQQLGYTPKYMLAQGNLYDPSFITNAGIADVSNAPGTRGLARGFAMGSTTISAVRNSVTGATSLKVQ